MFNGEYITSDVDEMYLKRLELVRNDAAKSARNNKKKVAKQQNLVADLN